MKQRAIPISQLSKQRFRGLEFEGPWADALGQPEITGAWLIWGNSGNGKTRFALQLAKYMCRFGRVAYNSLEEGASLSFQRAVDAVDFTPVSRRMIVLDKEPVHELIARLKRQKSPDIIIIDSVQYTGLKYQDYISLRDTFRRKLFILVSHADGKLPEGRVAKSIRYDAMVKVWVEGYVAYPVSRYGGGQPYVIWEEGSQQFYQNTEQQ
ncbi:MAG: hypothetical protein KGZ82_10770 [Bacteroidales bacterium]|nr:hypothetical protein [Bacteroidales bacterium]